MYILVNYKNVCVDISLVTTAIRRSLECAGMRSWVRGVLMVYGRTRRVHTRAGVPATPLIITHWHHYTVMQRCWRLPTTVLSR